MGIEKVIYFFIGMLTILLSVYRMVKIKKWEIALFATAMLALLPIAINFIVIMCPDSWIYTLMVYAFVLLPCIPLILFDTISVTEKTAILQSGLRGVLAVLICCYAYQTNVNYMALHYSNRQIENYFSSMIAQIRMTDGFQTDMELVFVGEIEDPLLESYWQYEMTYGGVEFTEWMLQRYSTSGWIRNYYGYSFPEPSDEKKTKLTASEEVQNMPCWPNEGSIQIIEDSIVIKCQP